MPNDETYPLKRCIGCRELLLGDGHSMSCCGIGPLCDKCHDTHEEYAHATIVTATGIPIAVVPPGETKCSA